MASLTLIPNLGYRLDTQFYSQIQNFFGTLPAKLSAKLTLNPAVQTQQYPVQQYPVQQQQAQQQAQYLAMLQQQQQAQQQAQYLAMLQQQQQQAQQPTFEQQLMQAAIMAAGTPQGQQFIGQLGNTATNLLSGIVGGIGSGLGAIGTGISNWFSPTPSTPYWQDPSYQIPGSQFGVDDIIWAGDSPGWANAPSWDQSGASGIDWQ